MSNLYKAYTPPDALNCYYDDLKFLWMLWIKVPLVITENLTAVHAWVKVVKYKLDFTSVNFYLISVSVSPRSTLHVYQPRNDRKRTLINISTEFINLQLYISFFFQKSQHI